MYKKILLMLGLLVSVLLSTEAALVQLPWTTSRSRVWQKHRLGVLLLDAALQGDVGRVQVLLNRGASVNAEDSMGRTPLHRAAAQGHKEVVLLLLKDPKVNVNARTRHGRTPLHRAAEWGCLEVVEVLLKDSRVDVSAKSNDGMTPYDMAFKRGHESMAAFLQTQS